MAGQETPRAGDVGEARLRGIGVIRSSLVDRSEAPKQGPDGAPDAWLEVDAWAADAMHGLAVGDEIIVITWLHEARRDVLQVHPRSEPRNPLTGVFATRSPDRPNPLGLHTVTLRAVEGNRLRIGPIEAIDGTPVVDVKPVLTRTLLVNIDVDDLARGAAFYVDAFGLRVEILGCGSKIYLLRKPAGSGGTATPRDYRRHWTPVHLDFVVDDLPAAVARAERAGAVVETPITTYAWGSMAVLADPFGHGVWVIQFSAQGYDALDARDR